MIEDGRVEVAAPPDTPRSRRAITLTEEQFFAQLDEMRPHTSERLLSLVELGKEIGLYYDIKKSLVIRLPLGDDYANVLVLYANGDADVSYVWWLKDRVSATVIRQYLEDVAFAIKGARIQDAPKAPYVRFPDRYLTIWDFLEHGDEWLNAVRQFRDAVLKLVES